MLNECVSFGRYVSLLFTIIIQTASLFLTICKFRCWLYYCPLTPFMLVVGLINGGA